jgi:hypothetical protein
MAPEQLAGGALHDAVVGIRATGIEDGGHARAQSLVFVGAGVQHLKGLPDQLLARGRKHLAQRLVAVDDRAIA